MLNYFRADELPAWQGTVTLNGSLPDLSAGWTFTVTLSKPGSTSVVKTTGITGATGGVFTVAWAAGDLDIATGQWRVEITARRTIDGFQFTQADTILVKPRSLAGP